MRIWKQITHGRVERGRRRSGIAALAALALAWAVAPQSYGATTPEARKFDHITTGFELLGQHRNVPCENCHANAIFKGTPTACGACHGIGTAVRASAKPATHILSTDQCQSCHTPWAWNPAVNFDHTQALGSCSTCHNGVIAQGKGPTHVVTDLECDVCHTTLSWAGAVFSHSGITSGCASCHNGVNAQGMVATHIPINDAGGTPAPCEGCHSPTNYLAWGPGTLINHAAVTGMQCASCHETAAFYGMHPSTNTVAGDSRPNATLDSKHPATGDCGVCHNTLSFAGAASKPPTHIPTTAPCIQCHTNPALNSQYSVTGVHQGVSGCLACHGPTVANSFYNITIVTTPASHMPIGSLDCNGSGCHTTTNVNPGGFKLGTASIASPTLTVAGHTTVAGAVAACQTCHETAPYIGMLAGTTTVAGDSRPVAALDTIHPATGDCGTCHTTTPTFAGDLTASSEPANHIPTTAPCAQCHTTAGNYAAYSVSATHQGVTGCLTCHGPTVGPFANVTMVTTPASHFPVGSLDCNGSGCHSTTNVNPGGFKLGSASLANPTLTVAGHATVAAAVAACQTCHETAPYIGMLAGTATTAGDSRPSAALDAIHPATGDCGSCHTTAPTFANDQTGSAEPANHIPTTAPCAQCHTTAGNDALYSVSGTHQGVTGCLTCHGPSVAATFANVTMVTTSSSHMPIGSLDCNGSGCHSTTNVNPGGFKLGSASLANPTLTVAGHATVAAAVAACQTCHETAPYIGMLAGTTTVAGDSRPVAALDAIHPATGDCGSCHTTTPTFANDQTGSAEPANHIPTTAPCAQCHTTAGNDSLYSVTGTHQGVTGCLTCHGPSVAATFANVTMVTTSGSHMPIGSLDCNGSGCHTTSNVNPGGFRLGSASLANPTLTVAGHATVAAAVAACQTCHESAAYQGMIASTAGAWGDSRPSAYDSLHPATGDCGSCHTTTPTFANDMTAGSKPANHVPTTAPCAQCHTTANNYAQYSVTATHQGVTDCLSCHGPTVGPFDVTIVSTPASHFPIGTLDCNGSGCHTATNVNPGGFKLGTANISSPTLNSAGHITVSAAVGACATCHETAPYLGMIPSTATAAADSRPTAFDSKHPTTGDCGNCHVQTPTFATNLLPTVPQPANHIPTTAVCAQCHTTTGNFAVYDVTGVHQGVTGCATCHGAGTGPFAGPPPANTITIVGWPGASHIPVGTLDCNGSGCHTTTNVSPGGFRIGAASIASPTLNVAGHTTVAAAVAACQTCHETAPYTGMIVGSATAAGDSRPVAALDAIHPTTGDCGGCHTTTPVFANDQTGNAKPANHIPTAAACAQCHTTAGNFALYSVTGTHQGVTGCLTCHGSTVATTFANVSIVSTPGNHFAIGSLDCNGSGCHTTTNVNSGGFKLGTASIASPTLTVAGHTTVAAAVAACQTCHETASYVGMIASTATAAGDSRPNATLDKNHPTTGDCGGCHTTTPTFTNDQTGNAKPTNHIPTTAACAQCHTTAGNDALYSVTGTHQGVTGCLTCHGSTVATTFANVTIVTTSSNHIPIGSLDCNGAGCHTATNVNPGGFLIGTANISSPTLTVAGHTTVAAAVAACQTCHETSPYTGMIASTATAAGDSRPNATLDKNHPTTGDCGSCHTTTPTFTNDQTGNAKPANHIPTTAACAQCHTTAGNDAVYSVTGTHQGVTGCLTCHGPAVATTFANVTIVTTSSNHMPIGSLDCNGAGCHTATNVNPGGFLIGTANISSPTLTVPGHTTVAAAVAACQTCHETSPYTGMIASTATAAGDSRPNATLDKNHPTTGDCGTCHTTTPTLAADLTGSSKPANHIPTTAACAQCHTTAGNYAAYSVTGTHTGVTGCLTCHGPAVATTFANVTIVTTASNHIPIGSLDCNGSGCHTTANVNPGGFKIGAASLTAPTLTVAGHTTVAAAVTGCQSCHETAPYLGMIVGTATAWGDSRPTAYDASHPTTGDCNGCHTTTPTFATNQSGSSAKPSNHIPTTAACAQCHTTAGNYAAYVMGTTGHTGITNGCATCHAYGLSFYNMAPPTLVQPPAGATGHIPSNPPNGSKAIACELCHSPTVFTQPGGFSGTVMKHAYVTTMTCMSCHEYGMTWKTNTGVRLWVRDSPNHHPGVDCGGSGCHTARDRNLVRATLRASATAATTAARGAVGAKGTAAATGPALRPGVMPGKSVTSAVAATAAGAPSGPFNHAMATGTCVSCHNGTTATGKPASHITTTNNCQSCHTTLAWLPVTKVDHSQVIGTCVSCHNGTTAMGKPSRHIVTAASCDSCHTTNGWVPARFDHAAVRPHTCNTCHNGLQAIGMARAHIPTTQQCDSCHGTLAWVPALVDHSSFVGSCARCHNNVAATGLPPNHFVTHLDCSSCHGYPDWSVIRFHHVLTAAYPGDHSVALTCAKCHTTNTEQVAYAAPAYAGTCAGCHAKDYLAAKHPKIAGGRVSYTVGELANCTGACHVYSDATLTTISKSQPGPRHQLKDARF